MHGARALFLAGMPIMKPIRAATFVSMLILPLSAATADEGMWTFDAFPAAKMRADYGWAPDQPWLDRVARLRSG
jgi:high-affinity nickel permease